MEAPKITVSKVDAEPRHGEKDGPQGEIEVDTIGPKFTWAQDLRSMMHM